MKITNQYGIGAGVITVLIGYCANDGLLPGNKITWRHGGKTWEFSLTKMSCLKMHKINLAVSTFFPINYQLLIVAALLVRKCLKGRFVAAFSAAEG